ncbi:hypothetical protein AVEN_265322-1 [Araneus ventricosus]|uniref:Uncharacterized protein n=1 Tax=Araneus ventricosus TaxID=182803 RepID=A0A4Y2MKK2_ARAVE|nr:hypothetical protein AVEN_265322-1 [Araneus ventricosus]
MQGLLWSDGKEYCGSKAEGTLDQHSTTSKTEYVSGPRTESVLGAAIRLERKPFRTKTRVNTVTRYYGTMRRFAGETGAASLLNDETSATRSGYTTLPRKCEQRH